MSSAIEQEAGVQAQATEAQGPETPTVDITKLTINDANPRSIAAFSSLKHFEDAQRMALALAKSTIVPSIYRGSVANCLVAMEIAGRVGASVLMVMQNLYIVDGKPGWSAVFLIASVNSGGKYSPIRYEIVGGDDPKAPEYRCRAYATHLASGEVLSGEWITWDMVKGEGWLAKDRSKWKTMPGQMFRYRSATFWVRGYAPELSLGMQSSDELEDITASNGNGGASAADPLADLNASIKAATTAAFTAPTLTAADVQGIPADTKEARAPKEAKEAKGAKAVTSIDVRAPLDDPAPQSCGLCGRSDGTHDPDKACYTD